MVGMVMSSIIDQGSKRPTCPSTEVLHIFSQDSFVDSSQAYPLLMLLTIHACLLVHASSDRGPTATISMDRQMMITLLSSRTLSDGAGNINPELTCSINSQRSPLFPPSFRILHGSKEYGT